jgi:hypothetical protein
MNPLDEPKNLEEEFADEMKKVGRQPIKISLHSDVVTLVGVLGVMQLALRHPGLADVDAAKTFADWARQIELRLADFGPAIARICSMGWSPENDLP